jgi:hypothetical protein
MELSPSVGARRTGQPTLSPTGPWGNRRLRQDAPCTRHRRDFVLRGPRPCYRRLRALGPPAAPLAGPPEGIGLGHFDPASSFEVFEAFFLASLIDHPGPWQFPRSCGGFRRRFIFRAPRFCMGFAKSPPHGDLVKNSSFSSTAVLPPPPAAARPWLAWPVEEAAAGLACRPFSLPPPS